MQVEDMIKLGELTEFNILKNLELRYTPAADTGEFSIYTYTGCVDAAVTQLRRCLTVSASL